MDTGIMAPVLFKKRLFSVTHLEFMLHPDGLNSHILQMFWGVVLLLHQPCGHVYWKVCLLRWVSTFFSCKKYQDHFGRKTFSILLNRQNIGSHTPIYQMLQNCYSVFFKLITIHIRLQKTYCSTLLPCARSVAFNLILWPELQICGEAGNDIKDTWLHELLKWLISSVYCCTLFPKVAFIWNFCAAVDTCHHA